MDSAAELFLLRVSSLLNHQKLATAVGPGFKSQLARSISMIRDPRVNSSDLSFCTIAFGK
jgi:hypothetical protein